MDLQFVLDLGNDYEPYVLDSVNESGIVHEGLGLQSEICFCFSY